jgi:hypothetical protein
MAFTDLEFCSKQLSCKLTHQTKKIGEKAMLKIKLTAITGILSFVGFVFLNSQSFSSSAKGNVFEEIAKYKTWTRINEKPIKVFSGFTIDGASGSE